MTEPLLVVDANNDDDLAGRIGTARFYARPSYSRVASFLDARAGLDRRIMSCASVFRLLFRRVRCRVARVAVKKTSLDCLRASANILAVNTERQDTDAAIAGVEFHDGEPSRTPRCTGPPCPPADPGSQLSMSHASKAKLFRCWPKSRRHVVSTRREAYSERSTDDPRAGSRRVCPRR